MSEIPDEPASVSLSEADLFLAAHGAADIPHPGGTLLAHLRRVRECLADWGASGEVQLAGLCHATYGTDGFAQSLIDVAERPALRAVIGDVAESLVYLYGSCDRGASYPRLVGVGSTIRDRFAEIDVRPDRFGLRAFLDITAANELDVFAHNADLAEHYGPGLFRLLERNREAMSAPAWAAVLDRLG